MTTTVTYASFYDMLDDGQFSQKPTTGAALMPLRTGFDEDEGGIPQGWAEFAISGEAISPYFYEQNTIWNYIQRGRVCTTYTYEATAPTGMIPIATFVIQEIEDSISGPDMTVRISGPSLLEETNYRKLWEPIGQRVTKMALLTTVVKAPRGRTIDQNAPLGQNWIRLNSVTDINEGDEARFNTDNGALYIVRVTNVDTATRKVTLSTSLTETITQPRLADFRTRGIQVDHPEYFAENDRAGLWVASLPGSTLPVFWSNIEQIEIPEPEAEDQTKTLWLKNGIPSASHSNKQFFKHDYSTPTSDDVRQAMAPLLVENLGKWTLFMQAGRATQTAQVPNGATIYQTLKQIAKENGESFRLRHINENGLPVRTLHWIHTPQFNGIELITPQPNEIRSAELDANKAIIRDISVTDDNTLFTVAYITGGKGGDERLTIRECDAATIAYANEQGFLIESDGDDVIPDAIRNHTLGQQYGRIETSLDFPDIVPTDNSPAARTAAANKMLRQAVHEMYRYHGQRRTINVTCIAKKAIRAGDLIALTHIDNGHFGLRSYQYNTPDNYLFVTAASVTSENDVLQYELTLSTLLWGYWAHQETDASVMANLIATVSSMRTAGNVDPSGNGIVSGPGTIVEPPAFIAGNGIQIAGSTISVNVPALAGNGLDGAAQFTVNPTEIKGNALRAEASNTRLGIDPALLAGPYLAAHTDSNKLTANLATLAPALAGGGLSGAGSTLAVNVTTPIQITGDSLSLKLGTYPGLLVDGSGGLVLNTPLSAGAMTANTVGEAHTHAVITAVDGRLATNANAAYRTILAANYQGALGLASLSTPLIKTDTGENLLLQPATKLARLLGNLQLTDGNAAVTATTGQLAFTANDPGTSDSATLSLRGNRKLIAENWSGGWGIQSHNYTPQLTGWSINYGETGGHGDFRSFFADELHVRAFIADLEQALAGGQIITKSVGVVNRKFALPDATNTTIKVYVEDLPGFQGVPVFDQRVNDRVRLVTIERGTGLIVAQVWGEVQRNSFTDEGDGEQSWNIKFTYLGQGTAAAGKVIGKGAIILDYGREPHAHFYEVSAIDPSGAPYARAGSITQFNANGTPAASTIHFQGGNLASFSTLGDEVGVFAGDSLLTRHAVFSNRRGEMHGIALTLYDAAGRDNLRIRLHAISLETQNVAGGAVTAKFPTSDLANGNIRRSSGASAFYTYVNNNPATGQPDATYLSNNTAEVATIKFGFAAYPTAATIAVLKAFIAHEGTSTGDNISLYAQLTNGNTAVSDEVLIDRFSVPHNTTNGSFITVPFTNISPTADFAAIQLQFNWRYEALNRNATIKLDPLTPSIAAGNPLPTSTTAGPGFWVGFENGVYQQRTGDPLGAHLLYDGTGLSLRSGASGAAITLNPTTQSIAMGDPLPTGTQTGGSGLWVGAIGGGAYALRLGGAYQTGPQLLYDGTANSLALRRTDGTAVIRLDGNGDSYFNGPMTIGTGGGIWQGTGTFAAPANGMKVWNQGGKGRIGFYETGTRYTTLKDTGIEIALSAAKTARSAITFATTPDGSILGGLYGHGSASNSFIELGLTEVTDPTRMYFNYQGGRSEIYLFTGNSYVRMANMGGTGPIFELNDLDLFIYGGSISTTSGTIRTDSGGISAGTLYLDPNNGQFISNLSGTHDYEAVVLMDTADVAHGMTAAIANTAAYGAMQKVTAAGGGLDVKGFTEAAVGLHLQGFATTASATNNTAPVVINALLKVAGGTGASTVTSGNLLSINNSGTAQVVVKYNGDIHTNGSGSLTVFDEYDDPALLRALSRVLNPAETIRNEWDRFVRYNQSDLEAAGILDGGMVNQTALARLLTGAVWQLHSRLAEIERRLRGEGD